MISHEFVWREARRGITLPGWLKPAPRVAKMPQRMNMQVRGIIDR